MLKKNINKKIKKVFVSGCFDPLHSGHIVFFENASKYGDLYVSIGSDKIIMQLKKRPVYNAEKERLYCVSCIKFVKKAFLGSGHGMLDFLPELLKIKPDIFVVNKDGHTEEKKNLCKKYNIKYVVLARKPKPGLPTRNSTGIRSGPKINKKIVE